EGSSVRRRPRRGLGSARRDAHGVPFPVSRARRSCAPHGRAFRPPLARTRYAVALIGGAPLGPRQMNRRAFASALVLFIACAPPPPPPRGASKSGAADWSGLRAVQPIDAHTHVFGIDPEVMSVIETAN